TYNRNIMERTQISSSIFNPTPFAVIADEYLDQLVRASPLLFLPTMMPINMNLLFFRAERFNSKQSTT
ncbi:unnamed protein product, partial [Rotaria socialis]